MDLGAGARGPSRPRGVIAAHSPEAALLALALFGAGALGSKPVALALAGALAFLAYLGLRPRWREVLSDLRFLGMLCLLLFLFQALRFKGFVPSLDTEGAQGALWTCARIVSTYATARSFYAGMGVARIRDGLDRLSRPFARILGGDGAAGLALALGFVPAVLGIWLETEEAARARGYGANAGRGKGLKGQARRLFALSALLAAFLRRLLIFARDVAEARATRGAGAGLRTLSPLRLSAGDALLVGAAALPLFGALA